MIRVVSRVADIGICEQNELEMILSHLKAKGYLPLIRSMFSHLLKLAKVSKSGEGLEELIAKAITQYPPIYRFRRTEFSEILGEIFITKKFIYLLTPLERKKLQASVIGYNEQKETLQKFCKDIEESFKSRLSTKKFKGIKFHWETPQFFSSKYARRTFLSFEDLLKEESSYKENLKGTKPEYSLEDIKATEVLINSDVRRFMLRLAQVRKMSKKDATKLVKLDTINSLISLDLMSEEYLLTCKQDQHTICVVPSKEHITKGHMSSLRCSICGRPFPEENLQVIYTLTKRGKKLIDGNLWMSIWITELLKKSGIEEGEIKWNLEASGEELDIMVEAFDSRLFFELKDREFGLGDAYPFVYRITRYRGSVGVIATMDKISKDAKKFFEEEIQRRMYPLKIKYLEGSKEIQKGIPKIIEERALSQISKMIYPFSVRVSFDLMLVVKSWLGIYTK